MFSIFILLISIILNFSLIFKKQEPLEENESVNKLNDLVIDPIFALIEKINETLVNEFLEELTLKIGPRRTSTSGCEIAAKYIFKQFKKMGLETIYHEWRSRTHNLKKVFRGKNVVATLPGKGELSNEILFLKSTSI